MRWNVVAADDTGDPFTGGLAFYATGTVGSNLSNSGVDIVTSAAERFVRALNQACPDSDVCLADASDFHYAGRDSYGDNFGLSGLVTSSEAIVEANTVARFDQLGFEDALPGDPAPRVATPYFWGLQDGTLTYGIDYCTEFEGFDERLSVQHLGVRERAATWIYWDGEGGVSNLAGLDNGNRSVYLCTDDTCPTAADGRSVPSCTGPGR